MAFLSCATVATSLRVYVRGFLMRNFGWDDFWMVMALVSRLVLTLSRASIADNTVYLCLLLYLYYPGNSLGIWSTHDFPDARQDGPYVEGKWSYENTVMFEPSTDNDYRAFGWLILATPYVWSL